MGEPEERREWAQALAEFRRDVFPAFAAQGIAFGEAFLIWQVNNLLNEVSDLATDPDDDAPWRTEPPDALEG